MLAEAAFFVIAPFLRRDNMMAAFAIGAISVLHYLLFNTVVSDFIYFASAAAFNGFIAFALCEIGTKTAIDLALSSLIGVVLSGIGYFIVLLRIAPEPYNVAILILNGVQMAILIKAGIDDCRNTVGSADVSLGLRNRLLCICKDRGLPL